MFLRTKCFGMSDEAIAKVALVHGVDIHVLQPGSAETPITIEGEEAQVTSCAEELAQAYPHLDLE
jgi:hypothetical protein